MKSGYLSQYFDGVAAKCLSAVEVDVLKSNQHEFNGVEGLRLLLGEPSGKITFPAKFMYMNDSGENPVVEDGFLTWYDARQKAREEKGVMRTEYRLYFPTNRVSQLSSQGDLLFIAKQTNGSLLAIVAEANATIGMQLIWLFGLDDLVRPGFSVRDKLESEHDMLGFASRFILESIGVDIAVGDDNYLEEMLNMFSGKFPKTMEFSNYARSTLNGSTFKDGPDDVLMSWMEREEVLFRTLERHLISEKLASGFADNVEDFIAFSLSVQNRRKSRAGHALENHLECGFKELGIQYSRTAVTENKSKPDFIFPGHAEYHDEGYDVQKLTMLGVKSSCKDRWRQVLSEAARIENKHLFTLEAAISINQTNEMIDRKLQLILPSRLHDSYAQSQRAWLMNLVDFTDLVLKRQ